MSILSRKGKTRSRPVFEKLLVKDSSKLLQIVVRLGIVAILLVIVSLVQLQSKFGTYSNLNLQEGEIAAEDIVAEMEFQVPYDEEKIARDRQIAEKRIIPVISYNEKVTKDQLDAVDIFFKELKDIHKEDIPLEQKVAKVVGWEMNLSQVTIDVLLNSKKEQKLRKQVRPTLARLFEAGVIADKRFLKEFSSNTIIMKRQGTEIYIETEVSIDKFYDEESARKDIVSIASSTMDTVSIAFYEITSSFIIPNLRYDSSETRSRISQAIAGVPTIKESVLRDEKIIGKNERVDGNTYRRLQAYPRIMQEAQEEKVWEIYIARSGQVLFSALLLALIGFYIRQYRRKIYNDFSKIILISILIAIVVSTFFFTVSQPRILLYLVPITVVSMLITILFDEELAIVLTILISLLLGTLPDINFYTVVIAIIGGVVASHSVRRVRHRHQFYKSMLMISLAYICSTVATDMMRLMITEQILQDCFWGAMNGIMSTILTIGILPVFESLFHITTDVTLLELGDFDRPLLRKLTLEVPGTHSHSLVVSNLSESAAEAIGANALLCRVACYYHDVGKTVKPDYFVENQRGHNPHDSLAPSMSTLIIISHVKEGIEMAKKAGLPQCIIDFIPEHHGTSFVTFFYNRALERGDAVNEYDFRYPGPKPQSKETAIVMIADSIESAARALKEPTANRLKDLIHKIINMKFTQGQLDECDLTFEDLTKIGDAFLPILIGIHHTRIDYPDLKKTKNFKDDLYQSSSAGDKSATIEDAAKNNSSE